MFAILVIAYASGCDITPATVVPTTDETTTDPTAAATATVTIASFQSNFELSELEPPISVIYSVITDATDAEVSGFYVPVADGAANGLPIGDRVITHSGLPVGQSQAFTFDPQSVDEGFYRVGVIVIIADMEFEGQSTGVIQVQGSPAPRFFQPCDARFDDDEECTGITEVAPGAEVIVSFDAGDPEDEVQWRLFYLAAGDSRTDSPDDLGTQLLLGFGNVPTPFFFPTAGLPLGDYELGVSATDAGSSIAAAVANGNLDRIVTIPRPASGAGSAVSGPIIRITDITASAPPAVKFSAPDAADTELLGDQKFNIRFTTTITGTSRTALLNVFYDDDTNPDNAVFPIAERLIEVTGTDVETTVEFDTTAILEEGEYSIGVTVRDGIHVATTDYAAGKLILIRRPAVIFTEPATSVSLLPASEGEDAVTVDVVWTTNIPIGSALVDVFAKTLDSSDQPVGPEILLLGPSDLSVTETEFGNETTGVTTGLYEIFVRVIFNDAEIEPVLRGSSPAFVRVSSLPRVLWLEDLVATNPSFEGAIFTGINREDNAGAAFAAVNDLDGDGMSEFIIVSRYGKPFTVTPSGAGPGEAYMVFGAPTRLSGSRNLNTVGTTALRGVRFTGIPTATTNGDSDGLRFVTQIPDSDGDGTGELAFGFPRTDSPGAVFGRLESPGQFLHGGVVIVSSGNTVLREPQQVTPVLSLGQVGQIFTDMTVTPGDTASALEDRLMFQAGDPLAVPPTVDACVAGTDEVNDTIVGPSVGFIDALAPPLYDQLGFSVIPGGTPPGIQTCVTQTDVATCQNPSAGNSNPFGGLVAGSGFYPESAGAVEPRGARIIGLSGGDRFGSALAASPIAGVGGPGDLVILAPTRTAATSEFDFGVLGADIPNAGVGFVANNRNLWGRDSFFLSSQLPPTPHQYMIRATSHCGADRAPPLGQFSMAGAENDRIDAVATAADFAKDRGGILAFGAGLANNRQGKVYVAYRSDPLLENGVVLGNLSTDSSDGFVIISTALDQLGTSLATGVDFNRDGRSDLVIGSPGARGGVGEVLIVFGDPTLTGEIDVHTLLFTRNEDGMPRAVRIAGNELDTDGQFGFNVATAGDINDDGLIDLLIAAPGASPRFDPDPTDTEDVLTTIGIDSDIDGQPDNEHELLNAGLVYVISGASRLDRIIPDPDTSEITADIADLGSAGFRGLIIAGRRGGDRIGGGDLGDENEGGIRIKGQDGRSGRSLGLASAGDVDGDGRSDILIGAALADPDGDKTNGGEAYLVYSTINP